MKDFKPTEYTLMTVATSRNFEDSGWVLADTEYPKPSLVRAIYDKKQLDVKEDWGFYRFADWLPIRRMLKNSATTVTYKSEGLAKHLGLENLYIAFSGYWPEKGAKMRTCSFKETEAYSVCGRLPEDCDKILVVASAGNTARAFAQVCSENNIPLLLSVPEDNIGDLWFSAPLNDCVKLVCPAKGSDYFDAICIAQCACMNANMMDEGGAKNVARRDGMGTSFLSAAVEIGQIPDVYFQAIGSGTGAIAAWEANMRLLEDGRFGNKKTRLYTAQNIPFTPMYDAFKADSRDLLPMDDEDARIKACAIDAKVLSNRRPPYGICGGVYDALKDSNGEMFITDNATLHRYMNLFEQLEGCDINPAAAVAVAALVEAVETGKVRKDEIIMLNITGGGKERFMKDFGTDVYYLKPSLIFSGCEDKEAIAKQIAELF